MSIDLTRDELERLTLVVSAAIMNLPGSDHELERLTLVVSAAIMNLPGSDRVLDGILDKLLAALADPEEHAGPPVRPWDAGVGEGD